jgi:prevent-host-death family protein
MPVSDLRRRADQVIQAVREEGSVVYITQYGRLTAVLLDYEQYQAMRAQLEMLTQDSATTGETSGAATTPSNILASLAAMAEDLGIDDLAENHDHYLYGVEKR